MNTDIRLNVNMLRHHKTVKLKRRLGPDAVLCLLSLWLWSAQHRPDGILSGMTDEDIDIAAGWDNNEFNDRSTTVNEPLNDRSIFVETLVDLRFIDTENGEYALHDWTDHNGYAASAVDRSDKSRFSRMAKTHSHIYAELKEKGVTSITAEEYHKLTTVQRPLNDSLTIVERHLTNRLSPLPSPSPSPLPLPKKPLEAGGEFFDFSETDFQRRLRKSCESLKAKIVERWPHTADTYDVETEKLVCFYRDRPSRADPSLAVWKWFERVKPPNPWEGGQCTPEWLEKWAEEEDAKQREKEPVK